MKRTLSSVMFTVLVLFSTVACGNSHEPEKSAKASQMAGTAASTGSVHAPDRPQTCSSFQVSHYRNLIGPTFIEGVDFQPQRLEEVFIISMDEELVCWRPLNPHEVKTYHFSLQNQEGNSVGYLWTPNTDQVLQISIGTTSAED